VNHTLARFALILAALAQTAQATEPQPRVVAFVGKLISINELPDQCPDTDKPKESPKTLQSICIQMNSLYEAQYEVIEILNGDFRSKEITFKIADHNGFPDFADYQHALLFVDVGPTQNWLEKYQGYAVHPTSTNSWASCGNPYYGSDKETPPKLRPISFANDFGSVGEFSKEGIARRFYDSKEIVVDGDRITCRNGIYASDLYETVRTGVLSARGILLPALDLRRNDL